MSPSQTDRVELRLARHAMATRFELVLRGEDPIRLRAIGEEALDELDRVENLLSLYRPHTDIARINSMGVTQPVPVSPEVIQILKRARHLTDLSDGAFDPTSGALIRVWGFHQGQGKLPGESAVREALALCGWRWVEVDADRSTVRILRPGVIIDLGAIGKGYAIDRAVAVLEFGGVDCALIQGGTSTVFGIGDPEGAGGWAIAFPSDLGATTAATVTRISGTSLSMSAPSGKGFVDPDGRFRGHILDPRTGWPADQLRFAAVAGTSATESDALSTALQVGGQRLADRWRTERPDLRCWIGI